MLRIITAFEQLPYTQIMEIYEQSNHEKGKRNYPCHGQTEQLLLAEQDCYAYLQYVLEKKLAIIALWLVQDRGAAALRLEKYGDGLLLTALETAPNERKKGYATALVQAVVNHFADTKIYSHIYDDNHISIAIHEKCGFQKKQDNAVFLDGSTTYDASTYLYRKY